MSIDVLVDGQPETVTHLFAFRNQRTYHNYDPHRIYAARIGEADRSLFFYEYSSGLNHNYLANLRARRYGLQAVYHVAGVDSSGALIC